MGTLERYTVERSNTGDGVLSTLTINNVMEVDFQTRYNCTAWNAFGPQTAIIQLEEKGGQSEGAAASAREGLSPAFHLQQLPLCPREGQEWGGECGLCKFSGPLPMPVPDNVLPFDDDAGFEDRCRFGLSPMVPLGFPSNGTGAAPLYLLCPPFPPGDVQACTSLIDPIASHSPFRRGSASGHHCWCHHCSWYFAHLLLHRAGMFPLPTSQRE